MTINSGVAATLDTQTYNVSATGQIGGGGTLIENGSGTLTLGNRANTYAGGTTINAGTLNVSADGALGNAAGSVLFSGNGTLQAGATLTTSRAMTINSGVAATIDTQGYNLTVGGVVSGYTVGGLAKIGDGTLTLNANNTYTGSTTINGGTLILNGTNVYDGGTTINNGTLRIGVNNGLPIGTAVTLANVGGAILDINGHSQTIASLSGGGTTGGNVLLGSGVLTVSLSTGTDTAPIIYGGAISGSGSLVKQGIGEIALIGNNSYTGGTTIGAGSLWAAPGALGTGNVVNNAILRLYNIGNSDWRLTNNISGDGTIKHFGSSSYRTYLDGNYSNFNGTIENVHYGLELTHNTYSSAHLIADSATTIYINGNDGNQTIAGLSGAGTVCLDGPSTATLTINDSLNDWSLFYGAISDNAGTTGSVVKSGLGTLVLAGANTYTGGTIVNAGTLLLGSAAALGNAANGIVVNGGTLDLGGHNLTAGAVTLLSGDIVNSGNSAAITASSYFVMSGTISANLAGAATLAKTTAGTVTLSGANSYTGTTTVKAGTLELGTAAESPVLSGAGADVQGGTLVFDYTSGSDIASTVQSLLKSEKIDSSTGYALGWSDNTTNCKVTIVCTVAGDANLDYSVNGADLGVVLANFNKTGMNWCQGDFNYDGSVNGADLGVVLANFNQSVAVSAAVVASPTVTINQAGNQADPTSAAPIHFTVVFSEAVSDFTAEDVTLGGTALGKQVTKVSGTGTTYNVEVGGMTGSGTVVASIAAGKANDVVGNPNAASTSTDNSVQYTLPLPSFALSGPISGTFTVGQTVPIQWTAGNVKAGSKISLCYDADASFNENEHWIEIDGVKAADGSDSYTWNTTGVAPGTYYVAGYLWDGGNTFTLSHLVQAITIVAAPSPTFALSPDRRHVSGGPDGQCCMDGRQREGRQQDQPLLRCRRQFQQERTLDRNRRGEGRRRQRRLRLEHCGGQIGHVHRRRLYVGWQPHLHHVASHTDNHDHGGAGADLRAERSDFGHIHRRPKRFDPVDG